MTDAPQTADAAARFSRASASARSSSPRASPSTVDGRQDRRQGPEGHSSRARSPPNVDVKIDGAELIVSSTVAGRDGVAPPGPRARAHRRHGEGRRRRATTKTLELVGTGYRAEVKGTTLTSRSASRTRSSSRCPQGIKVDDPRRLEGHDRHPDRRRQGADRADRREDPRLPSAGAVRRQGRSLPGREGPREGGQGRQGRARAK